MEAKSAEAAVFSVAATLRYLLKDKHLEAMTQSMSRKDTFLALSTGLIKVSVMVYRLKILILRPGIRAGHAIAIIVSILKALVKARTSYFRDIGIIAAFGNISMDSIIRGEF
uniref:Uncharacterized protein n=1 Tax=Amphimedon queenslandica TaxID=400682 RepID=A0A1X7TGD4_AMPQE